MQVWGRNEELKNTSISGIQLPPIMSTKNEMRTGEMGEVSTRVKNLYHQDSDISHIKFNGLQGYFVDKYPKKY